MADYDISDYEEKRLRYFNTQFLEEQDFIDEQKYHINRQRLHNRFLHTPGIADGLDVNAPLGAAQIEVEPGVAVDSDGRQIVLASKQTVPLDRFANQTTDVLVVVSYREEPSDPAAVGVKGETRWHERPNIEAFRESEAPSDRTHIRLGRLTIRNGQIARFEDGTTVDESVRTRAGTSLGDEATLRKLILKREGDDPEKFPTLTSGDLGRADLAGDLLVTGDVEVAGAVQMEGNVGIGPAQPQTRLHVQDSKDGVGTGLSTKRIQDHVGVIENTSNRPAAVLALKMQIEQETPFITFFNRDQVIGAIIGQRQGIRLAFSGQGDYAEWLPRLHADEQIEAGHIVGVFGGQITKVTEGAHHIMAISSRPIIEGNMPGEADRHLYARVAFVGQVPIKVRGAVQAGDYIVPSGRNDGMGIAISPREMTPARYAQIVGKAWESSDEQDVKLINTAVGLQSGLDFMGVIQAQQEEIKALRAEVNNLKAQLS